MHKYNLKSKDLLSAFAFMCTYTKTYRAQICKPLKNPGIDSNEPISPGWESIAGAPEKIYKFGLRIPILRNGGGGGKVGGF